MTMFVTGTAAFVLCFFVGQIQCGYLLNTVQVHVNESCTPDETECGSGCCPYADAVCCSDGFECCQHGQTCIPYIGICVGAVTNNGEVSLISEKSAPIKSSVLKCPSGTAECGADKCCLYEHGVCCSDGQHCCPNGYRCDVPNKKCLKGTGRHLYGIFEKPFRKMSKKSPFKSCPGGNRMCPNYMSCCVNDNGSWGCCPNPSLPEIRYGDGECCDTIFGHMCCPDDYPTCTIFGCTN